MRLKLTKKIAPYDVGNPGSVLGQAQNVAGLNQAGYWDPNPPLLITGSPTAIQYQQMIKYLRVTYLLLSYKFHDIFLFKKIIVVLIAYRADWLLKFLYRTSSVQFSVAGLQPIKWDNRRMHNIDLSDIVSY